MKPRATIIEVGPRDGLQAEPPTLSVPQRIDLIERLIASGLTEIEVGAFVNPKAVPAMADSDQVLAAVRHHDECRLMVLVPNEQGYEAAKADGASRIALFLAASESFSKANTRATIAEATAKARAVAARALADGMTIRGYVSTVIACPYEGEIKPNAVLPVVEALLDMGCDEISLGDTVGRGTPRSVKTLLSAVLNSVPAHRLAWHGHDTYGMGIANICAALDMGLTRFDASVAGLGGCPYAPGATGNVASEDVAYLLTEEGYETGLDLMKMAEIGHFIAGLFQRETSSRAGKAMISAGCKFFAK